MNGAIFEGLQILYYFSYFWIPIFLAAVLAEIFIDYTRAVYKKNQTYFLLEVKVPKEVLKSPKAAEFFIAGMRKTDFERSGHEKYWKGQTRQDFALEIASIDGAIHFFIWTRKGQRNIIEANIYSQYPGVEIHEVPDYTLPVKYDPATTGLNAFEFDLIKPDVYPIKTYVDYGMDKDPKEEYKIDPLTPLIEFMASLGRGHQAWYQILLRANKDSEFHAYTDPETKQIVNLDWKKAADKEIEGIQKKAKAEIGPDGKLVPGTGRFLHDVETEIIKALGRSVSKTPFDVGIRVIYTAPKNIYVGANIGGMIGAVCHFNSNNLNGFKPARGSSDIIDPLNKLFGLAIPRSEKARDEERQDMLDAYKRREYFYKPHKRPHFVLNSEELATIFHFPGEVSTTPTFERVESKKTNAPANLPL